MEKQGAVYIMTNHANTTLYVGVTSNLLKRICEHRQGAIEGFSKRYRLKKLVYYELMEGVVTAIAREKQIKGGSRKKKIQLIESINSEWRDLYDDII